MKCLFAIGIFSVMIYLSSCECQVEKAKKCAEVFQKEKSIKDVSQTDKCFYGKKMLKCLRDVGCSDYQEEEYRIEKLNRFIDSECKNEISVGPQGGKGEHQAHRSLFSMWIAVMIALVILNT